MDWLTKEWEANYDLRFGQLLINLGIVEDGMSTWNAEMSSYDLPHKIIREIESWGQLNKKDLTCKLILIKDLETQHIKNILKTQVHIKDTEIERILREELKYRINDIPDNVMLHAD